MVANDNAELTRILDTREMKKIAARITEVRTDTPESFAAFMRDEHARSAKGRDGAGREIRLSRR